jgi:hypothetical protein
MATMKQIEQNNKAYGAVSFGKGPERVLLIPWGPNQGFFTFNPTTKRVAKTGLAIRFVKVAASPKDRWWTKQELACAKAVKSGPPNVQRAIASVKLREALEAVPAWALKRIRQESGHFGRCRVAKTLCALGEKGLDVLVREGEDAYLWDYLFEAARLDGREHMLKHYDPENKAGFFRKLWPKATDEAHKTLLSVFEPEIKPFDATYPVLAGSLYYHGRRMDHALRHTYSSASIREHDEIEPHQEIRSWTSILWLMNIWGATPRKRPFADSLLIRPPWGFQTHKYRCNLVSADVLKWPKDLQLWAGRVLDEEDLREIVSEWNGALREIQCLFDKIEREKKQEAA